VQNFFLRCQLADLRVLFSFLMHSRFLFFRDRVAVRWDLKFKIPLLGWPSLVFLKVTVRFLNISGVD
jgi:hypothetical protein